MRIQHTGNIVPSRANKRYQVMFLQPGKVSDHSDLSGSVHAETATTE